MVGSTNIESTIDFPVSLSVSDEGLLLGDVNQDGTINSLDASAILMYLVGLTTFTSEQMLIADVDGDGLITSADASYLLQYLVGIIPSLNCN